MHSRAKKVWLHASKYKLHEKSSLNDVFRNLNLQNHLVRHQPSTYLRPCKHFLRAGPCWGIRKSLRKSQNLMFENVEQIPAPAKHVIYGLANIFADWAIVWYTKEDLVLNQKIAKCSWMSNKFQQRSLQMFQVSVWKIDYSNRFN